MNKRPSSDELPQLEGGGGRRLLLASISALGALLGFEVLFAAVDVFEPRAAVYAGEQTPVRNDNYDERIGWRMPPHRASVIAPPHGDFSLTYHSNGSGFRDREFELDESARRVAFLGDSFTFGVGVEQDRTFIRLLENRWEGARTYNYGMSGFGIDQMVLTYEHFASAVEPRLIVLSFVLDDLERSLSAYRWRGTWMWKPCFRLAGGELVQATERDRPSGLFRFLESRSRVIEAFRRLLRKASLHRPVGNRWHLNRALFERLRDACESSGTRLLVVHASRIRAPVMGSEFADMGIAFLDIAPEYPADASSLFFEHDPHWNEAGHRFAADRIDAFVRKSGLLD